MTRLQVRPAGPADVEALVPLFDAYRVFYGEISDFAGARRFLRARLTARESVVFVASLDGKDVGFTQLYPTFSSVNMKRLWNLNDLYVAPHARRSGVAMALLERARRFAVQDGARGLVLETFKNNPARAIYEKAGYGLDTEFYHYALTW